jgi:hypothetical protein
MSVTPVAPSRLWKQMTAEQRLQAARAFWRDEESADEQVQAALLIAERKKFRPKTVVSLDEERQARHLASLSSLPDALAARVVVAYHLAEQRPMMSAFLDALGIEHESGLIRADDVKPDPASLGPAAAGLAGQYPPEHVSLYLNTLLSQDPQTWSGLAEVPERLARVD